MESVNPFGNVNKRNAAIWIGNSRTFMSCGWFRLYPSVYNTITRKRHFSNRIDKQLGVGVRFRLLFGRDSRGSDDFRRQITILIWITSERFVLCQKYIYFSIIIFYIFEICIYKYIHMHMYMCVHIHEYARFYPLRMDIDIGRWRK